MRKQFIANAAAQRTRILERLRQGACSTFELRHELDVPCVAPRIYELRYDYGFNIQTHWTTGINPGGNKHRIAKYVLMSGAWKGGKRRS